MWLVPCEDKLLAGVGMCSNTIVTYPPLAPLEYPFGYSMQAQRDTALSGFTGNVCAAENGIIDELREEGLVLPGPICCTIQ